MTISFRHGIAVAPLQAVMAVGALVNGGRLVKPAFLRLTTADADNPIEQVIKPKTEPCAL